MILFESLLSNSVPFIFDYIEYVFLKKLSEIISGHSYVNIIIYLNGNAHAVALSNTKATRKHDLVVNMILLNSLLKKLNYILRALEMTRRANTNLNK